MIDPEFYDCGLEPEEAARLERQKARTKPEPLCAPCLENHGERVLAQFRAERSTNGGKTRTSVLICATHADGWNDGGDWDAPVVPLASAPS